MPGRVLTIEEVMAILPATPLRLAALTDGLAAGRLHTPPEPDAWSVNGVLAHLRACHDVFGGNIIRILSEDTPTLKAVSPRTWIKKTDYPEWKFRPSFAAFARQRAELLAVLEPLPLEGWSRTARVKGLVGGVAGRSVLYYGDWMAGHERGHLRHVERIIAALGQKT